VEAGPIQAVLRSLRIEQIEAPPPAAHAARGGEFVVRMQVPRAACPELEMRLGGRCDGAPPAAAHAVNVFAVESPLHSRPLTLELSPHHPDVVELVQSGDEATRRLPSAWSYRGDAGRTVATLRCWERTALTITVLLRLVPAVCVPHGVSFEMRIDPRSSALPSVFLNDVSQMEASFGGRQIETAVDRGTLLVGDSRTELDGGRAEAVKIGAAGSGEARLGLTVSALTQLSRLSVDDAAAAEVSVGGREEVPSWIAANTEWWYLALGVVAGFLLDAIVSYVASTRR
jgi:hypothetical protein